VSTCTKPGGSTENASIRASSVMGVSSDGLTITALPAANDAAACQPNNNTGKLNGTIETTVPNGSFRVRWVCPGSAAPATLP
jgi:hypothetical protein